MEADSSTVPSAVARHRRPGDPGRSRRETMRAHTRAAFELGDHRCWPRDNPRELDSPTPRRGSSSVEELVALSGTLPRHSQLCANRTPRRAAHGLGRRRHRRPRRWRRRRRQSSRVGAFSSLPFLITADPSVGFVLPSHELRTRCIGDDDADFDQVPRLVRSDQHRTARLVIRAATGD